MQPRRYVRCLFPLGKVFGTIDECSCYKTISVSHFGVSGFAKFMYTGWTLCGDESAQCIERGKMCDDVIDCVNGWDERVETCPDHDVNSGRCRTTSESVVSVNFH